MTQMENVLSQLERRLEDYEKRHHDCSEGAGRARNVDISEIRDISNRKYELKYIIDLIKRTDAKV